MNLRQSIKAGFSNYATFSGRATPPAFWYWLMFIVVLCALPILAAVIGRSILWDIARSVEGDARGWWFTIHDWVGMICGVLAIGFAALVALPTAAVATRRAHDFNATGWYAALLLAPGINFYILFGYMSRGIDAPNDFGPSPYSD